MPYAYILQSIDYGAYYTGSTVLEAEERLKKHNSGQVISTKSKRPWKLVCQEKYVTLSEARKREKQIKSWKDRSAIERLVKKNTHRVAV